MKGLLRGLRYISQIFDEKEPEMEIGFPTEVKHVAHIGWEGPSASKPSWMNDFQSSSDENSNSTEEIRSRSAPSLSTDGSSQGEKQKRRSRRQTRGLDSPMNSPGRKNNDGSKHSRRQTTTGLESPMSSPPMTARRNRSSNASMDSPSRDSTSSTRSARQLQASHLGTDSPARDQPSIPRHSRGRKNREPSRLKDKNSSENKLSSADRGHEVTESVQVQGAKNYASHLTSVLELYKEEDRVERQDTELRLSNGKC